MASYLIIIKRGVAFVTLLVAVGILHKLIGDKLALARLADNGNIGSSPIAVDPVQTSIDALTTKIPIRDNSHYHKDAAVKIPVGNESISTTDAVKIHVENVSNSTPDAVKINVENVSNSTPDAVKIHVENVSISASTQEEDENNDCVDTARLLQQKTTLVVMGHSTARLSQYWKMLRKYGAMNASLDRVVLLWCNPRVPRRDVISAIPAHTAVPVLLQFRSESLNNRFNVCSLVRTTSFLTVDDDVLVTAPLLKRLLNAHHAEPRRIVALDARRFDLQTGDYLGPRAGKISQIGLTRTCIFSRHYLRMYMQDAAMTEMVDRDNNCEDLAMNFLVHNVSGQWARILHESGQRRELPAPGGLHSSSPSTWGERRNRCVRWLIGHFRLVTPGPSPAAPGSKQPTPGPSPADPGSRQPGPGSSTAPPGSRKPAQGSSPATTGSRQPAPESSTATPESRQPVQRSSTATPGSRKPAPGSSPAA